MKDVDQIVKRSLSAFLGYVQGRGWFGREHEAVSLYAFGFLQHELTDPKQIGIEVGAADARKGPNSQVRKDLLIWDEPAVNRWYPKKPRKEPVAIIEWKVRRPGMRGDIGADRDVRWLKAHCASRPETLGYSVVLDLESVPSGGTATLRYTRVTAGDISEIVVTGDAARPTGKAGT